MAGKLTNLTKKSAEFKELKKLRRVLATDKGRAKLQRIGQLDDSNARYQELQGIVVKNDTVIRQDRAAAKLLSKTVLPKTFVPFDPKGSGFLEGLQSEVDAALSIFKSPSQYVPAEGAPQADGTGSWLGTDFKAGLSDLVNTGIQQQNEAIAEATADANKPKLNPVLIGSGVLVVILLMRKR